MAEVLTIDDFEQELEGLLYPSPKWGKLAELASSLGEEDQVDALREALERGDDEEDPIDEFFAEFVGIVREFGDLIVPVFDGDYAVDELTGRLKGVVLPEFSSKFETLTLIGADYVVVPID